MYKSIKYRKYIDKRCTISQIGDVSKGINRTYNSILPNCNNKSGFVSEVIVRVFSLEGSERSKTSAQAHFRDNNRKELGWVSQKENVQYLIGLTVKETKHMHPPL